MWKATQQSEPLCESGLGPRLGKLAVGLNHYHQSLKPSSNTNSFFWDNQSWSWNQIIDSEQRGSSDG